LIGINIVIVVCAGANVSVLIGRNIRVVIRVGINIRIVCHCVVGGIQAFANSVPAVHVPVCCADKFVAPSPIRKMPTKSSLFFCPLIILKI
jgi:hypothetical protein